MSFDASQPPFFFNICGHRFKDFGLSPLSGLRFGLVLAVYSGQRETA
jgi:hypothetical protein